MDESLNEYTDVTYRTIHVCIIRHADGRKSSHEEKQEQARRRGVLSYVRTENGNGWERKRERERERPWEKGMK
jgi:hypothetical protein